MTRRKTIDKVQRWDRFKLDREVAIEKYCKTKRQQRSLELVLQHAKLQQIIGRLATVFEREVYLN